MTAAMNSVEPQRTAVPICESALVPPRLPPTFVRRRRVNQLLRHAVERPLTIIGAPAGYGKTVAVAGWRVDAADEFDIAWLTLDERDTTPERFWEYVVAALERMVPDAMIGTRDRLDRQEPPTGETFVRQLVNDLCRTSRETVVVIDDFDVADRDTLRDLADLIDHLPPNVHVVLACRADPLLPRVRWSGDGTLFEVRASDLRFSDAEAEAFLELTVSDEIDPARRSTLRRRCDGWIAALHLAALGILRSADPDAFIEHLSGTFSPIADYLVAEVVACLDPQLRAFVLETSVLDELAAPICDAVTQRADSATVLAGMVRSGLFLSASTRPGAYRYHPLFRATLTSVLRDEDARRLSDAHRRAASWLVERGLVRDALRHAMAAEDHPRVLRWLSEHADDLMMSGRDVLPDLVRSLACDRVDESARIRALLVRSAVIRGSVAELERMLASRATSPVATSHRVELAAASLTGRFDEVLQLLAEPTAKQLSGSVRQLAAGKALTALGRFEAGAHPLRAMLDQRPKDPFIDVAATSLLGWNTVKVGHLRAARTIASRAVEHAADANIRWFRELRFAELTLAQVAYDVGLLDDAHRHAQNAVDATDHCALSRVEAAILLARIEWALGNRQHARDSLAAAFVGPDDRPVTGSLSLRLTLTRAELHLKEQNLELAESWLPDWRTRVEGRLSSLVERLVLARFLIADDRPEDARHLLIAEAATARTTRYLLEAWRLDAIAAARANDPSAPMALEISYAIAAPEGFAQGYVEDAPVLAAVARGSDSGVVSSVGVAHAALAGHRTNTTAEDVSRPTATLVDDLTDRELDVLRLLPSRLSNTEIAQELFVSVNTVKSHIKRIYRKLEVTSRDAAVATATSLRIT